MKLKRYEVVSDGKGYTTIRESPTGHWVRFDDADHDCYSQADLDALLAAERELPGDVRDFIYHVTLGLQRLPAKQTNNLFQDAYKLYVKYDVENKRKQEAAAIRAGKEGGG